MQTRLGFFARFTAIVLVFIPMESMAARINVTAEAGALSRAIKGASSGDTLYLMPGIHAGPVLIDKPITLDGRGLASVQGNNQGSVITVSSPGASVRGLKITGSGSSGEHRDSAIKLLKSATGAVVRSNQLIGNLIGVDIHGARDSRVIGNTIEGRRHHRMNSRGNGIYLWNSPGAKVIGNDVRWGRDGIFVNTSSDNEFRGNRFRDLRFAIHYMYAHNSLVADNISIGNHLGYALMFSKNLTVRGNLSSGDRDYGMMLNYTNSSRVEGNHILKVGDRCVFIYNAHKNKFFGNRFEGCGTGVHFTAGSERNQFSANAFIGNRTQVKYVGSRWLDWSAEDLGNYWSDHAAYDLNGDEIADSFYRPNDQMDRILWTQPAAKMLLGSPAVQLIRWSLSSFPALTPGGIVDRKPMMRALEMIPIRWEAHK